MRLKAASLWEDAGWEREERRRTPKQPAPWAGLFTGQHQNNLHLELASLQDNTKTTCTLSWPLYRTTPKQPAPWAGLFTGQHQNNLHSALASLQDNTKTTWPLTWPLYRTTPKQPALCPGLFTGQHQNNLALGLASLQDNTKTTCTLPWPLYRTTPKQPAPCPGLFTGQHQNNLHPALASLQDNTKTTWPLAWPLYRTTPKQPAPCPGPCRPHWHVTITAPNPITNTWSVTNVQTVNICDMNSDKCTSATISFQTCDLWQVYCYHYGVHSTTAINCSVQTVNMWPVTDAL